MGLIPRRLLALALIFGLLSSALTLASRNQAQVQAAPLAPLGGKPNGGLSISITPRNDSSALGAAAVADVSIRPERDVAGLNVAVHTTGALTLNSPATLSLPAARKGSVVNLQISYAVGGAGQGELRATVAATNDKGAVLATTTRRIYTYASATEVLYGVSGPLDLQIKRLRRDHSAGRINDEEFARSSKRVLYGGATETGSVRPGSGAPDGGVSVQATNDVTVTGRILWTDSAGGTHAVRSAPVEIWDDDVFGDELITTVTTNDSGDYSATVNNDDGFLQGGRDIYIRALAQGPGFTVKAPGSSVHAIESNTDSDVANGATVTKNLTANNTDDNNTAFSVHDAMTTAVRYIERVRGSRFPDTDVIFPTDQGGTFYSAPNLHVLREDRFDWDVVHHEYGHFVADQLNIENNPGGSHSSSDNLAEARGKDVGIRLAWGEGWPTYFGTSLQQVMGAAGFGIPNVGDTHYQDTDDQSIDYDLETQTGGASLGEDNELSSQRILWDLYDSANDRGDNNVAMGDQAVWNTLDAADPPTLFAAYRALTAGKAIRDQAQIGCIFGEHKVAPAPNAPADKALAPKAPPTFRWDANGGGPSNLNNKFIVEFYNYSFDTLLFATPEQDAANFTPTQAQWDDIVRRAGPLINWVVKGRQTNAPVTGPYTSCARSLVPPKLDLIFVIDTTGSMWDDIDSVKASASSIVDTITASGADYRIELVDYKDHPISPYGDPGDYPSRIDLGFSTNKTAIINAINSLSASGGNDWPEAVFSGLMSAINSPWRSDANKAIILMGDAPPHDPEPVTGYTMASVIAAANNAGVAVPPPPNSINTAATATASSTDGAHIYPILVGFDYSARVTFQQMADGTGGELFEAGNASQVVDAILAALDAILKAPIADAGGPYAAGIGQTIVFDGGGSSDSDGTIVRYQWDFESDGVFDADSANPTASHAYPAAFAGIVTLRVTDNDGRTGTDTAQVEVGSSTGGLVVGAITAPPDPIVVNTTNDVSAAFTDPGVAGPHTAIWSWDDGSTSAGTVTESGGSGVVSGRHAYSAPGVYELRLTVTNRNGVSAQATFRYIVVYDPSAGFVTGGGWINSPAGAYAPDPSLTGKANFGFIAKYQRGATVPTGSTEFQFKAGNMNFSSASYDWLVIAGARAQYKGVGTINGAGSYRFMLTAIDGAINGGGGVDKFRIKIWDAATGGIVYDNQLGAGDNATPTTTLGGGSIIIHTQGGQ